jgi:hypothetical protein
VFARVEPFESGSASQAEHGRQRDHALNQGGDCPARVCFGFIRGSEDRVEQVDSLAKGSLVTDAALRPSYAPTGAGIPSILQIPLAVFLLIVVCLGTGACDCVLGFTQMSWRLP